MERLVGQCSQGTCVPRLRSLYVLWGMQCVINTTDIPVLFLTMMYSLVSIVTMLSGFKCHFSQNDISQMIFAGLSEELDEARNDLKRRATFKHQQSQHASAAREPEPSTSEGEVGWGLCGLGDKNYPIGLKLVDPLLSSKYIQDLHSEWNSTQGAICEVEDIDLPDKRVRKPCSGEFCLQTSLWNTFSERDSASALFSSSKNLVKNVCRSLRPLYSSMCKQITYSCKHPLLLVRSRLSTGEVIGGRGWIITMATFRPINIYGIDLSLPETLEAPCEVEVKTQTVFKSNWLTFAFTSSDKVSLEIAQLKHILVGKEGIVEYCFQPPYSMSSAINFCRLQIQGDLTWTPVSSASVEDDSEDEEGGDNGDGPGNDDQTEEDEVSDIMDCVSNLVGSVASSSACSGTQPAANKGRQRTKKTESAGSHRNLALIMFSDSCVQMVAVDPTKIQRI